MADSELYKLNDLIMNLNAVNDWELYLFRQSSGKNKKTLCRSIEALGSSSIKDLVLEIQEKYSEEGSRIIEVFEDICPYDATGNNKIIYKIDNDDPKIVSGIDNLYSGIANANRDNSVFDYIGGYILQGTYEGKKIKLISIGSPIKQFKDKFVITEFRNVLTKVERKVLALKYIIDVLIIDEYSYFLTTAAERFFDLERSYKILANTRIDEICNSELIGDTELFVNISSSGHNPRRLVKYNPGVMESLQNEKIRERVVKKFKIPLTKEGKLDTSTEKAVIDVIKLLCDRAMLDPIELEAREVDGARSWG